MILVTGGTGFIGSRAVRRLVSEGRPVRALARRPVELPGAEVAVADLTDAPSLVTAMAGVETVIHAAAITGDLKEPYRGAYDRVNRVGTENLMAAAAGAGVRRVVLLSGLGTVPAPAGTYMATRWGMEEAVRRSGLDHVILQPSVLFGDGAEFVSALARLVRASPVVPVIGPASLQLQPLWVQDLVTCVVRSTAGTALLGRAVPIGGPERMTFADVMRTIMAAMGKRRLLLRVPLPVARVQAALMTAVLPHPPLTPAAIELFSFDNATDADAVERAFGFRPRSFRAHLAEHGVAG